MEIKDLSQVGEVLEKINTKQASIDQALAGALSKKDVEGLQNDLKEVKSLTDSLSKIGEKGAEKGLVEYVLNLQKQADANAEELKRLKNEGGQKSITLDSELERMFKSDNYQKWSKKEISMTGQSFDIKGVKDITTTSTANSFTQTNSPIIPYQRDPRLGVEPRKALALQNVMARRATGTDTIDWLERTTDTSAAAMTAESGQYAGGNSSVLGWTSYVRSLTKITDLAAVTREKLDDTTFVREEIMKVLNENIPFQLESQLWTGDGTSNGLYGILGSHAQPMAQVFAAPTGTALAVKKPNMYSALKVAALQVKLGNTAKAKGTGFNPNYIFLNPVDAFLLSEEKDDEGQPLFGFDGVMRVQGIPVIESQFITAGTYLVGDFTKFELWTRAGLVINMWDQYADYAAYGRVVFTAEMRCTAKLMHVDKYAFVYGTFENTISAITKVLG